MKTTIIEHDEAARQVKVRFEDGDVIHDRTVNACYVDGSYDLVATTARVADVARGVAVKIGLGVIANVEAPEMPTVAEVAE